MLRIAPFQADTDHVVPLELEGEVNEQDFKNVLAQVEDQLTRHDKLRIYVEVKSLGKVSPAALIGDLKNAVKHWNRFEKQAIVTDISGFETAASLVDKVTPGIEIKVFAFDERESAHQWIIG